MTQCALEEATELMLGMRGFTTYAETISVYGTEPVFMDGDDTPYSKAFLASCYASRGLKMRFTSGTGSEVTPFAIITDETTGKTYQAQPFPESIQKIIQSGGLLESIKG